FLDANLQVCRLACDNVNTMAEQSVRIDAAPIGSEVHAEPGFSRGEKQIESSIRLHLRGGHARVPGPASVMRTDRHSFAGNRLPSSNVDDMPLDHSAWLKLQVDRVAPRSQLNVVTKQVGLSLLLNRHAVLARLKLADLITAVRVGRASRPIIRNDC